MAASTIEMTASNEGEKIPRRDRRPVQLQLNFDISDYCLQQHFRLLRLRQN